MKSFPLSESFPLTVQAIEHIHDVLVGVFMPFDEKVGSHEHRDYALIDSALKRPYQSAFGEEAWPTIHEKAAVLFHSLVCNHCFLNGNKRTAVIALDLFLGLNTHILLLGPEDVYALAKNTAQANEFDRDHEALVRSLAKRLKDFTCRTDDPALAEKLLMAGPIGALEALLRRVMYATSLASSGVDGHAFDAGEAVEQ